MSIKSMLEIYNKAKEIMDKYDKMMYGDDEWYICDRSTKSDDVLNKKGTWTVSDYDQ